MAEINEEIEDALEKQPSINGWEINVKSKIEPKVLGPYDNKIQENFETSTNNQTKYQVKTDNNNYKKICLQPNKLNMHTTSPIKPIVFSTNSLQTVESGVKNIILGTIDSDIKLYKININVVAKEQGWGNLCSFINIAIVRGNNDIIVNNKIPISTKPRTSDFQNYTLENKYDMLDLMNGDKVMLTLYAPHTGCMVGIKNAIVTLNGTQSNNKKPNNPLPTCNLQRGQEVYTGCGYTYAVKDERDKQCGGGGTSKWIGDDSDPCKMERGEEVYTGCGYTYGSQQQRDKQCGGGGTSKWIGDGLTY